MKKDKENVSSIKKDFERNYKSISEFFNQEYLDYSTYDNYRSFANIVDGLKPSARKCLYTYLDKNITDQRKVEQMQSLVADYTNYIHGGNSLYGVIVGMTQDFVGSNNIKYFEKKSNFGSRFEQEASAGRYIYNHLTKDIRKIYMKDDDNILIDQYFEGEKVEPKFFVPIIPMLLVNGSDGLSLGFRQLILPRNPLDIISNIRSYLQKGRFVKEMMPWYKGFKGTIEKYDEKSFAIYGKITKSSSLIDITEVPIGYDLVTYLELLESLLEKKIISFKKDESDKDQFQTKVKVDKKLYEKDDIEILENLKLVRKYTEQYVAMNENNRVEVFEDVFQILERFITIRLEYYQKRKEYLIKELEKEINVLKNRLLFLKLVLEEEIEVRNVKKDALVKVLESHKLEKIDDSFDYLLNMAIYTLTKEKFDNLINTYKIKKQEIKDLEKKDIKDWYLEDLKDLEKIYGYKNYQG